MNSILKARHKQIQNRIIDLLTKYPLLSSLVIVIPILTHLLFEVVVTTDWTNMTFNSNIIAIIQAFGNFYLLMINELLVIASTIFLFFNSIDQKIYWRYKSYPVCFIDLTRANVITMLFFIDTAIILFYVSFSINNGSTTSSLFTMLLLLLISINSTIVIAFTFFIVVSYLIKSLANKMPLILCSLVSVLVFTIPVTLLLNQVSIFSVMNINSLFIIIPLIVLSIIPFVFFDKFSFSSSFISSNVTGKKTRQIFLKNDDIGVFKNYYLLLADNISVYVEYIVTFAFLVFVMYFVLNQETIDISFYSLVIVFLLTSNGLINHYHDWFVLRKKEMLQKTLLVDSVIFVVLSIITSFLSQLFLIKDGSVTTFLVLFISSLICLITQRVSKLKFSINNNTMMSFTLFYGVYSYIIILITQELLSSV